MDTSIILPVINGRFDAFEFGTFQADNDADLILCSMAWLHPVQDTDTKDSKTGTTADSTTAKMDIELQMINYWALRLSPLIKASMKKPIVAVICNRYYDK